MRHQAFTLIELLCVVAMIAILAAIAVPNFLEAQTRTKVGRVHTDLSAVEAAIQSYYADYQVYPPNHPAIRRFFQATTGVGLVQTEDTHRLRNKVLRDPQSGALSVPNNFEGTIYALKTPDDSPITWIELRDRLTADELRPMDHTAVISTYYGFEVALIPPWTASGFDLKALTTPVNYDLTTLPIDVFGDSRMHPYVYVDFSRIDFTDSVFPRSPLHDRYLLLCFGSDVDQGKGLTNSIWHPLHGPFIPYEPTNGTISPGDIFRFGR